MLRQAQHSSTSKNGKD